jgi:hypothetical protein
MVRPTVDGEAAGGSVSWLLVESTVVWVPLNGVPMPFLGHRA